MKFVFSQQEISDIICAHVEEQYGRRAGKRMFHLDSLKGTDAVSLQIDDAGPMPEDAPAPTGIDTKEIESATADLGKRD